MHVCFLKCDFLLSCALGGLPKIIKPGRKLLRQGNLMKVSKGGDANFIYSIASWRLVYPAGLSCRIAGSRSDTEYCCPISGSEGQILDIKKWGQKSGRICLVYIQQTIS